jgi:hypothetical protein
MLKSTEETLITEVELNADDPILFFRINHRCENKPCCPTEYCGIPFIDEEANHSGICVASIEQAKGVGSFHLCTLD